MWALTTHNATLTRFDAPEDIPDGYAIISHVWTSQEDSFQHVQSFNSQAATRSGYNSRDHLSDKMRMFCTLAESYGYRWAWSDTACINKESSAELSGDINSMFNYYAAAQICFVYLADVPGRSDPWQPGSYFRRSKWHRRGWTLQELLAPEMVVFLSVDWGVIGTKAELSGLLSEITSIPEQILTFEADITDVSIAQRMSWAAKRSTTREEDQAYCLLGIFGINMPMLYGEGGKAFYRLQEELMRTSNDTSLWAWG
ncbi:uncharacterized protein BXZ73DRAFT_1836, partial [Epithele typhae]|uniref:uncharacterized protein n=1 Tax=Epithele typhae TaxID=378194 RepID=UPI0020073E03